MITICKYYIKPGECIHVLCPAGPSSKCKVSAIPSCQVERLILWKCNITPLGEETQSKQKIWAKTGHHWSTKSLFLCVQTNWICQSEVGDYVKMALTWVTECGSSRVIWYKTRLEPSHWLESRYHWYLLVYRSQNLVRIVHLESQGATYTWDVTYTRIAWKRAWWLVQVHTHASAFTRHTRCVPMCNVHDVTLCGSTARNAALGLWLVGHLCSWQSFSHLGGSATHTHDCAVCILDAAVIYLFYRFVWSECVLHLTVAN